MPYERCDRHPGQIRLAGEQAAPCPICALETQVLELKAQQATHQTTLTGVLGRLESLDTGLAEVKEFIAKIRVRPAGPTQGPLEK